MAVVAGGFVVDVVVNEEALGGGFGIVRNDFYNFVVEGVWFTDFGGVFGGGFVAVTSIEQKNHGGITKEEESGRSHSVMVVQVIEDAVER